MSPKVVLVQQERVDQNVFSDSAVELAMVNRGTVRDNVSADITDTSSHAVMDEGNISAVRGSLAAGNGYTSIGSSESLTHTTTAGEST